MTTTRWLTARRVDLLLGVAVTVAAVSGLVSWGVGSGWARWVTVVHALAGMSLLALAPAKLRGSVRTGLKRRRASRWLSMLLGALVVATIVLGILHATGVWHGGGLLVGAVDPFPAGCAAGTVGGVAHREPAGATEGRRPGSPRAGRRRRGAGCGRGSPTGPQQLVVGDNRRFTGSHEIASFNPSQMPTTMWLNDRSPRVPASEWHLTVAGEPVIIEDLQDAARPVVADIDCTGGWWSRQSWDAVPLAEVMAPTGEPTLEVASLTGYSRLFPGP